MDTELRGLVHAALDIEPARSDLADRLLAGVRREKQISRRSPSWRTTVLATGALVVFALAVAAGLQGARRHAPTPPSAAAPSTTPGANGSAQPINIQLDVDRFVFGTPESMCNASLVVDATVTRLAPGHWNSADGSRPAGLTEHRALSEGWEIVTPIELARMQVLLDRRRQASTELANMGGTVGQDQYRVYGIGQVTAGARYVIVFLPGSRPGTGINPALLLVHDAFPIDAQAMVLLRPRTVEQDHVSPEVKLPLAQLAQRLASCPR